jgi:hypothetical protein
LELANRDGSLVILPVIYPVLEEIMDEVVQSLGSRSLQTP